jgi:Kef-type K+ transport system membrane component KefB
MNMPFFISIAIIFGFIGGKLVHQIKLPGVVGYLIASLILESSYTQKNLSQM